MAGRGAEGCKFFFNFLKNSVDAKIQNPCDAAMLRKMFRERPPQQWKIVEKDMVDEIIFRTMKPRNRIMLELMARGGMRVGEVLKIRPMDIQNRKLNLAGPKSGKESEVVFIPQKVADRPKEYVKESGAGPEQRVFPISYNAARIMVRKAGRLVGIHLRPHDLRRHAATFASRSGTPIEIVSKVAATGIYRVKVGKKRKGIRGMIWRFLSDGENIIQGIRSSQHNQTEHMRASVQSCLA